ncbi:hypothetical protein [Streptomyces sp. NPDC005017]|uniref:hypothetical protein n=1 Tax=Streptomyces sp. NPDC005017 TaxID=3364706 RepID=UPI0036C15ADD
MNLPGQSTQYSSRDNRACLRRRGLKATIAQPGDQRAHRKRRRQASGRPPAFDKAQYRRRNTVERCVNRPAPGRGTPVEA